MNDNSRFGIGFILGMVTVIVALMLLDAMGAVGKASTISVGKHTVTYVYDGDTIEVDGYNTIRYIGMNTPEKGHCYFNQAKWYNYDLIYGKQVTLSYDVKRKDVYGRTLAYVSYQGKDVGRTLTRLGYAVADYFPPDTKHASWYSQAQQYAKDHGLGLWSKC